MSGLDIEGRLRQLEPRNVDLTKTLPVGEVLAVLEELLEAIKSEDALAGDWNSNIGRAMPATAKQVQSYCEERADEARLAILAMIP